jgi:hypothetical protein
MSEAESPAKRGKRILEEEAAAEAEIAKTFDPIKLIADADKIQEIKDPILGLVKYTVLTTEDMFAIGKCATPSDQTKETMYRLLRKAYPELKSPDDILKLPAQTVVRLGEIIEGPDNFFQIPRYSLPGSKPTETPNTLG